MPRVSKYSNAVGSTVSPRPIRQPGKGVSEMKILKLCISRYSVLPALWVFLAATTYAQSSTRCTTTPDGAGASYTNCTTTTQPTDGSSQTQTQTNCTKTYDGSGGSLKNCTSNTTTTAPPAGGRLTGIAEVAAASSAAHPRPGSPTSPGSQSVPSITTTTAPPAGGRLTGIGEVAAASSAAHPRPVSPTSPGSQSAPSITTTTAPSAGGRLTGIAEVAAAYSAAHPRPVSPTSPASQSVPSITEASCPEAAKAYFDKGVKEGRMGGSYDVHFTKGACLIRVVYRSNIDMSYTEALSKVVTDATVAVFVSGVLMPATTALSTPMGKPVCTVITHKGKKQCEGLDEFHELVKKEYKI